jgi:hypothetical protein
MRRVLLLILALCAAAPAGAQPVHGVAVQVSQGQAMPTDAQIRSLTNPGDFVRDLAPWSRTDPACNLTGGGTIAIPAPMQSLYDNVAAAGRRNFLTLGFNNVACGQPSALGWTGFPNTPQLRAEFAAYAVQLVQTVPALGGISIWNEMNGAFNGGYTGPGSGPAKMIAYCQLANEVITEVRKVNKTVPIAIGASVGWNIQGWFTKLFTRYGCMGRNDPTIWLDVHPFISGALPTQGWAKWPKQIAYIRGHGINNPLMATEWGGSAAVKWAKQVPGGDYPSEFQNRIFAPDPSWAGTVWFEAMYDTSIPKVGLIDPDGTLNQMGQDYVGEFVP